MVEVSRLEAWLRQRALESTGLSAFATLRLDVENDLPPVRFARDALTQVLFNLVDNAVKYASGATPPEIVLSCRREGDAVCVGVRDHGPGLPPRQLRRVFEPFYRGDNELTRRSKGNGLGLALVRGLAERMGARVATRAFAADFPVARSHPRRRCRCVGIGAVAMGIVLFAWPLHVRATVVYSQSPAASGPLLQSSWWTPDGSDYDQYVWDAFILQAATSVTEIRWRGGYARSGQLVELTVAIYPSIPAGIQPDVVRPPLVEYATGGNAGETPAGTVGGVPVYDYRLTLPHAFQATAGTKYWVQIEASQNGIPGWSLVTGTGGGMGRTSVASPESETSSTRPCRATVRLRSSRRVRTSRHRRRHPRPDRCTEPGTAATARG